MENKNRRFKCVIEDGSGNMFNSINIADCRETIEKRLVGSEFKLISIEPFDTQLVFGIDYDGTFAADTLLFRHIIENIVSKGHKVVFVTGRSDIYPFGDEVRDAVKDTFKDTDLEFPIVFAGERWKKTAAMDAGFNVNIWVDDNPEYIAPQNVIKF